MGQKKSFASSTQALLGGPVRETPKGGERGPSKEKRPVGRPRIYGNHNKTTTSQEGLRDGLTRMTFIVSQEKQDKLKYISYFEGVSLRQILDEAIDDYINKYEGQVGVIELN